jgi:hypothetical protein
VQGLPFDFSDSFDINDGCHAATSLPWAFASDLVGAKGAEEVKEIEGAELGIRGSSQKSGEK